MLVNRITDSNKDKQPVIVISLGRQGSSEEVARQANLKNFYVHIFSPEFPIHEAAYAHSWTKIDPLNDFKKALFIAKNINPVAILVEHKNLLLPLQCYLADALGLRSIGSLAARTSNSKIALRQCLDLNKIKSVPWMKFEKFNSLSNFTFPAVIKPNLGTSSKGVIFLKTKEEILKKVNNINKLIENDISVDDQFLLEGYVKGQQFDFEGIAIDGEYKLVCVVEEYYESSPPYFLPSCFWFNPVISDHKRKLMWSNTKSALSALGVKNGAWHLEQRIDEDGMPRVIDYANRMGYNRLVSKASGIDFASTYVDIMTNGKKEIDMTTKPLALIKILALDKDTIEKIKLFARDYPEYVHSKNYREYNFSYHNYFGNIVLIFEDLESQLYYLKKYDLAPKNMIS